MTCSQYSDTEIRRSESKRLLSVDRLYFIIFGVLAKCMFFFVDHLRSKVMLGFYNNFVIYFGYLVAAVVYFEHTRMLYDFNAISELANSVIVKEFKLNQSFYH